jgi:hypothetical protein
MKTVLNAPCRFCDHLIPLSGDVELTKDGLKFVTDDEGTRAGWAHQAKHDAERTDQ